MFLTQIYSAVEGDFKANAVRITEVEAGTGIWLDPEADPLLVVGEYILMTSEGRILDEDESIEVTVRSQGIRVRVRLFHDGHEAAAWCLLQTIGNASINTVTIDCDD